MINSHDPYLHQNFVTGRIRCKWNKNIIINLTETHYIPHADLPEPKTNKEKKQQQQKNHTHYAKGYSGKNIGFPKRLIESVSTCVLIIAQEGYRKDNSFLGTNTFND